MGWLERDSHTKRVPATLLATRSALLITFHLKTIALFRKKATVFFFEEENWLIRQLQVVTGKLFSQ